MNKRILFVCYPDTNQPIGGVKQIYRQVQILNKYGVEAYVLQENPGFRATWFESDANVMDIETYKKKNPSTEDIIVMPETWLSNVKSYMVGIPKIIFNQNAFYSFGLSGECNLDTINLYKHQDIKGIVTVSEDSRSLLTNGCGLDADKCKVIINGIDRRLFHIPEFKYKRIVFLNRKHVDHARKVKLMAKNHEELIGVEFKELQQMNHRNIAKELKEALIFLSCGHPEGFGLPLAEAIACGCIVVGYHGLAGRDFALPYMNKVDFGDLLGLLTGIKDEVIRFERESDKVINERKEASDRILQRYSIEEEEKSCLTVWTELGENI